MERVMDKFDIRLFFFAYLILEGTLEVIGEITRNENAPLCTDVICYNAGTRNNATCVCTCGEGFTGFFCETKLYESEWPSGNYGLPMSVYGCPEPPNYGWKSGYINMTIIDSSFPSQNWKGELSLRGRPYPHLIGPYTERSLQLNFCMKTSKNGGSNGWPRGSYCIYKGGDVCPDDFQPGSITMTGYEFSFEDVNGYLPDKTVKRDTDTVVQGLKLFFCCRSDNTTEDEYFNFTNEWPFHVLKYEQECPPHPTMTVSEEDFYYTVGDLPWSYSGVHPKLITTHNGTHNDSVKMAYCYYSPPQNSTWDWKQEKDNNTRERTIKKQKPVISADNNKRDEYRDELAFDGKSETIFQSAIRDWWIQIDLQTVHEVLFIKFLNPVELFSRFPNPITYSYHLLQSHLVVSKLQWVFLNNGAQACTAEEACIYQRPIHYMHNFICRCRKMMIGQYVTLLKYHTSITYSLGDIDVIVQGGKCGKRIGLVSRNTAQSGQISQNQADSSNQGLCIKSAESRHHLQVDLIVPMVIQGVTLQTWYEESNSYYNSSIKIYYGVNSSDLLEYKDPSGNQIFSLHNKHDLTGPKYILFAREILAIFLQIDVLNPEVSPCVKLEVIGCKKYVMWSPYQTIWWSGPRNSDTIWSGTQCKEILGCRPESKEIGWESIQGVSYRPVYVRFKRAEYTELDDCKEHCTNMTGCLSVTLEKNRCYLYTIQRYSYFNFIKYNPNAKYAEKICINKDVMAPDSCGHEIRGPVILTSPAYPLSYGDDTYCFWHVIFPENKKIRLDILQIDFPPSEKYKTLKCEDELTLSSNNEKITLQKEKHRGSTLYSRTNELEIEFTACHHISIFPVTNITRFAINISESDVYGCGFLSEQTTHTCISQSGIIASPFYPSQYHLKSEVTWKLIGEKGQYVQLVFSSIDIQSDATCRFSHIAPYDIDLQGKRKLIGYYCTHHSSHDPIRSSWNSLELTMTTVPQYIGFGFYATYEMKTAELKTQEISDNDTSADCESDWWKWKTSCYKFFQENTTMALAEKKCQTFGGYLLSIGDKEEMTYIQHLLTDQWNVKSPVIIGLMKKNSNQGLNDFRWLDGTVTTYYDWYKGTQVSQPDGHSSERCTYVEPSSLWSTKSWHDYMCAYNRHINFVCETSNFNASGINPSLPPDQQTNVTSNSWIHVCDTGEVISEIYWCDGVVDCSDSSDEKDCRADHDVRHFKCTSGQSIHLSLYCDHKPDCGDGSDESSCEYRRCLSHEWTCRNKQCIPWDKQCDFHADCWDKSDEENCAVCVKDGYQCYDQRCIPSSRVCDGFVDCSGEFHEDEMESCVNNVQESCEAWYRIGKRQNGVYFVSYGTEGSFPVECLFPTESSQNITVILHHDIEGRRKIEYFSKNKKVYDPDYGATLPQINRLMNKTSCRQHVKIECTGHGGVYFQIFAWDEEWFCYTQSTCDVVNNVPALCGIPEMALRLSYPAYQWFSHEVSIPQRYLPIYRVKDRRMGAINNPVTIGPLICEEDIKNISSDKFMCRTGVITSMDNLCILNIDRQGEVQGCRDLSHLENCDTFVCPEMNVKCPKSFCIPRNMYCDGTKQCPDGADEVNCENTICSGLYRCRNSSLCIPLSDVCDGTTQCQHGDDELLCKTTCPEECECEGFLVSCHDVFNITQMPENVRRLSIKNLIGDSHQFNFSRFSNLGHLIMQRTPLNMIVPYSFDSLNNLFYMDLSNNAIMIINVGTFVGLDNLQFLNISGNAISRVADGSFSNLNKLLTLDMRGNQIKTFYESLFSGLSSLQYLYTDEYRFCCIKPDSVKKENCYPAEDEFSSCEDLMKNEILRICLWTIGTFALIGNGLSIIFRLIFDRVALEKPHGIFVLNLCIADFLMGVYIYIIAIADEYYRGRYIWNEHNWRYSIGCKAAGFLVTLSSEASTTMLSIITLDRLLAIKFPFSDVRFSASSARTSVLFVWVVNLIIAIIPLLGIPYFEDEFYSRSGVCLALPLTRDRPPGWQYSVSIFLVYNFISFTVVAVGQIIIYMEIHSTSLASIRKTGGQEQQNIARNLFLLVFTDFICWFPVGIMGIAALYGHSIPGEVYAWTAVFILPINSALNPLLYTATAYLRKRERDRQQSQITELTSQTEKLQTKIAALERHRRITKDESAVQVYSRHGIKITVNKESELEGLTELLRCNLIHFDDDLTDGIVLKNKLQEIAQDNILSHDVTERITDVVKCLHKCGFAHGKLSASEFFLVFTGKELSSVKLCMATLHPGTEELFQQDMDDLKQICSKIKMENIDEEKPEKL